MKKLLLGLSLLVLGFGCARQSDNSTNQNANLYGQYQVNAQGICVSTQTGQQVTQSLCTNSGGLYQINAQGICVSTQTGQQVTQSLCTSTSAGLYQYNQYGYCVSTQTGQQVPTNLCQTSGTGTGQQCYGYYSYNGTVYGCGITHNCSGYTVISVQTNQSVYCQ